MTMRLCQNCYLGIQIFLVRPLSRTKKYSKLCWTKGGLHKKILNVFFISKSFLIARPRVYQPHYVYFVISSFSSYTGYSYIFMQHFIQNFLHFLTTTLLFIQVSVIFSSIFCLSFSFSFFIF